MEMKERVKVFTYVTGHGATLIEPPLEDHINQWLATAKGQITHIRQSESERSGGGQHVTVCIWYVPEQSGTTPS
jgi:hypothetical protein